MDRTDALGALTHASPHKLAAIACLALLSLAMWVAFFPLLADDAYIPARYVRQLYAGHGLVFNAGERINALTSPLHTLVLAAIAPLASDFVTAYRILALFLTSGSLVLLAAKAYPRFADRLLFLADPRLAAGRILDGWRHGNAAVAVPLFVAYLGLAVDTSRQRALARRDDRCAVGAAVLTRYDSILFVAPIGALCLHGEGGTMPGPRDCAIAALTILIWITFTQMYTATSCRRRTT